MRNSTELVEPLFESLQVGILETDCKSRQTLYSDGARDSKSFGRSRLFQFAQRSANSCSWYFGNRHWTTTHTSPQTHNREQARIIVGRSDSDWAGDSAKRPRVTGYHCNVHGVMLCSRSLKHCWDLQNCSKKSSDKVAVRLEMDSDSARRVLQTRGPAGRKHIEIRFLAMQQWIGERRPSVGLVDTKSNTVDIFTIFLQGPQTQSLSKELGLQFTGETDD